MTKKRQRRKREPWEETIDADTVETRLYIAAKAAEVNGKRHRMRDWLQSTYSGPVAAWLALDLAYRELRASLEQSGLDVAGIESALAIRIVGAPLKDVS